MVSLLDIFTSLLNRFKTKYANYGYYLLSLPERNKTPCFLFGLVYNGTSTDNKYLVSKKYDIQIIYFNTFNNYAEQDELKKLQVMSELDDILSCCNLNVKDRNIKYSYYFGDADGNLTINLDFQFKDKTVIDDDITYEKIQEINLEINS